METGGYKVSKEREAAANRADSEMLREISKGSGVKRRKLEKAGEGLQVLMALIERRRASGIEVRRRDILVECGEGVLSESALLVMGRRHAAAGLCVGSLCGCRL